MKTLLKVSDSMLFDKDGVEYDFWKSNGELTCAICGNHPRKGEIMHTSSTGEFCVNCVEIVTLAQLFESHAIRCLRSPLL